MIGVIALLCGQVEDKVDGRLSSVSLLAVLHEVLLPGVGLLRQAETTHFSLDPAELPVAGGVEAPGEGGLGRLPQVPGVVHTCYIIWRVDRSKAYTRRGAA